MWVWLLNLRGERTLSASSVEKGLECWTTRPLIYAEAEGQLHTSDVQSQSNNHCKAGAPRSMRWPCPRVSVASSKSESRMATIPFVTLGWVLSQLRPQCSRIPNVCVLIIFCKAIFTLSPCCIGSRKIIVFRPR